MIDGREDPWTTVVPKIRVEVGSAGQGCGYWLAFVVGVDLLRGLQKLKFLDSSFDKPR